MGEVNNPYLQEIRQTLPRLLASFDRDPLSPTLGLGDRLFWAWKTHDFPNATPQAAVNGLARLVSHNLLPEELVRESIMTRIDEAIRATQTITARDGSLVEAFPNEKSFCVTALVAFDILCAVDHLDGIADRDRLANWRETAAPLIDFIVRNDETHAIISNHLATAVAALTRWSGPGTAEARSRAEQLLGIILANQSSDGWYSEYGSADPGYETLGLYYLADVHARLPEFGLKDSLTRSLDFLTYCAHPDGSFGGLYGARNTRFIIPGGLEALAPEMPTAAALAHFARRAIAGNRVVAMSTIDDPNLAPFFNAYCQAATLCRTPGDAASLPHERTEPFRRQFDQSQLIVDNGPSHYTIVAPAKGGVVVHCRKDGTPARTDPGSCARANGHFYTTQALRTDNVCETADDRIVVTAPFTQAISERPSAFKFLVLRAMALTIFRYRPLTEWIKSLLVRRLITGQKLLDPVNRRTIVLGPDVSISDEPDQTGQLEIIKAPRPFTAIHMASAGYWQAGDDEE